MTVVIWYGGISADSRISYIYFTPLTEWVLNYIPAIYNPYHCTFISRTHHVDGGYYYEKPVIYSNSEGCVRKILVTPETADQLRDMITGEDKGLKYIDEKINVIKNRKSGFYYINISKYCIKQK